MTLKKLLIFSILPWINIGFLYAMYVLKVDNVLLGVYWELTMIPSFLMGVIFPIILIIKFIRSTKPYVYHFPPTHLLLNPLDMLN